MTDFTQYQSPGVYVAGTAGTILAAAPVPTATVTLVGPARGYQIHTQSVVLGSAVVLAKTGVLPDSDASPDLSVTKSDGTTLVENTDYTLTRGSTPADATSITWKNTSTSVSSGDTVVVSYAYADTTYYVPRVFTDYSSVESVYGPALVSELTTDSNQVASPLSMGARLAFENGASTVICLATQAATTGQNAVSQRTRFAEAYAKLAHDYSTTLLVPLFATLAVASSPYTSGLQGFINDVKTHCESQTADGYGRIALVGADTDYNMTTTGFDDVAANTDSKRVVLAFPHQNEYYNGNLGLTTVIGGQYLAAAYAGRLASSAINRGLTKQPVSGFSGIPASLRQQMSLDFKNNLSSAGVAVMEYSRNSQLVCRHGVSTDTSDIVAQEISITRCFDVLLQMIQTGLDAADLIGSPIDSETTIAVKGVVTGVLEAAKTNLVIRDWITLNVRQQALPSGNPTAIEAVFTYAPFLPLNYITVSFSMDLTTGVVTDTTNDTTDTSVATTA